MADDPRLTEVNRLIAQIFGDKSLTRTQARAILETIQEEIEARLACLTGDDDRSC